MSTTVLPGLTSFEKIGGQLIFWGASNFSNLLAPWASGSRSLMLRAATLIYSDSYCHLSPIIPHTTEPLFCPLSLHTFFQVPSTALWIFQALFTSIIRPKYINFCIKLHTLRAVKPQSFVNVRFVLFMDNKIHNTCMGAIQVLRNADGGGGCHIFWKKVLRRCNVQCY